MQKELSLQKISHIDFLSGSHTKRIDTAYEDICGKVDLILQEEVRQLAEMTLSRGRLGRHIVLQAGC